MISIVINAARLAPVAKTAIVKGAPFAKDLAWGIAGAIALNETIRFGVKRRTRPIGDLHLETFETERPLWKKFTNTHADETWGQGVQRRGRIFWDIACFAAGDVLATLDFFVVKIAKLALFVAGKALGFVAATVAATGISLAFAVSNMTINKLAALIQTTYGWIDIVTLAPFRAVRWVDRKLYATAWNLMKARSWRTAADQETRNNVVVNLDSYVRREQESAPADIHHLIVLLSEYEQVAKSDPKLYGAELFAKAAASGDPVAVENLRENLPKDLRKLGLQSKDVALAVQGFDEARTAASDPATS